MPETTKADENVDDELDQAEDDVDDEPVDLSEMDADDISVEDLENQDWTLGGEQQELLEFAGMKFMVEDPDDDVILNLIASSAMAAESGDGLDESGGDRMFQFVESAIVAPEMTAERWRNMKSGQRVGLTMRVAEFAGIHQMMDFPDGGQTLPQGE